MEANKDKTMMEVQAVLDKMYPHGHPMFNDLCNDIMALHSKKNHDYARGGSPLGNFERVGAIQALYPDLDHSDPAIVAMDYMFKQLDSYLWQKNGKFEGNVEGKIDRLRDVVVYGMICICIEQDKLNKKECGV